MALRADLESRAGAASTVEEKCKIAMEACQDPADKDYAKELLLEAESDCQMPADYCFTAEGFAIGLEDKDYAGDLLEEAEDGCFEAMEKAQVGYGYAKHMGDKEKGKELLDEAAEEAAKPTDFLTISKYIQDGLGDADFAKEVLNNVVGQCKTVEDFSKLAREVVKDDAETAKSLYKNAENLVDEISEVFDYAKGIHEMFSDKEWAASVFELVEEDAQFTKDCIKLAEGFKLFCDDNDKAEEMMDNAKDYAMSGEENIQLAEAYWNIFKNKETAAEFFEKGLNDVGDTSQLLEFAKNIATDIGDKDLAKKFYARAESKMSSAKDLTSLAEAVIDDLQDKVYAGEIYSRAVESIEIPQELMVVAEKFLSKIEDKDKTKEIYTRAFELTTKFQGYVELTDAVNKNLTDKEFLNEILTKAESFAETSIELLTVTEKVVTMLEDNDFAMRELSTAEEIVTNLDEMTKVNEAVKKYFADDTDWASVVDEKLSKRQENNEVYQDFQKREDKVDWMKDYLVIADEVMEQLDDKYYAMKLFRLAELHIDNDVFNPDKYRKLMLAINKHLGDQEWMVKILNRIVSERVQFAFELELCCNYALNDLDDKDNGKALAVKYLQGFEKKIDRSASRSVLSYTKFAKIVINLLDDKDWALGLAAKAASFEADAFATAETGHLYILCGDSKTGRSLLKKSAGLCSDSNQSTSLAGLLKKMDIDETLAKDTYAYCKPKMKTANDRLMFAEGIIDVFDDRTWAKAIYSDIERFFKSPAEREMFHTSKSKKLEQKYF